MLSTACSKSTVIFEIIPMPDAVEHLFDRTADVDSPDFRRLGEPVAVPGRPGLDHPMQQGWSLERYAAAGCKRTLILTDPPLILERIFISVH
jgi:hypothetical protein